MKHRNAVRLARWGGKSSRGVSGEKGGSLMTEMRKPASVNASVIACSGRCQYISIALCPLKLYSAEYCVMAK